MTTALLDFDGRVVGRYDELIKLRSAVADTGRVGGGCVLVSGAPGVGKSTLVQHFGAEISQRDCVFAYGRCREGAPAPYAALGDALRSVVRAMESTAPAERDRWRADLVEATSSLGGVLGELVPELAQIVGDAPQLPSDLDAADARRRLHRAAIRLVSNTATYRPVVLTMDDLQWADRDSLQFLSELLIVSPRNVLVVGAHRAGEFDAEDKGLTSADLRTIDLTPLSPEHVEELLAGVSGHGVEMTDVATEFHHRTGGNPLQVRQLLYRAQREGALTATEDGSRPSWDLRVLTSIEVPATALELLGRYLEQLGLNDRAILRSLTCIGGEFTLADAAAAAGQRAEVVGQALWTALNLRLLEALDAAGKRITNIVSQEARYRFSHDRVAEAAREGLSDVDARGVHLRLARYFIALGDERLFEAARHAAIGGRGLGDRTERLRFVDVLRCASFKARAQASFPLALEHCRSGLELLGESRWSTYSSLTRELHLDAADAAVLVGDTTTLYSLLEEAEPHLRDATDRARLAYLRIKGLVTENRTQDMMVVGLAALDELGIRLPTTAGKPRMINAVLQMRRMMRGWTTERLLELGHCEDDRVIETMRILVELCHMSFNVQSNLFPLLVRRQMELTLAHGHTPRSPVMLANFGLMLVMTGDRAGAQRFGESAMTLAVRPEFRESLPQTVFLNTNFIRHWGGPVREGIGVLRDSITEALDRGDVEFAGWLSVVLMSQSFWVGRPMAEIDSLARSLVPQIQSQIWQRDICKCLQQITLNLMRRGEDPFLLAGESGYDEREAVPAARLEGNDTALSINATVKLGLHYWAGDYDGAVLVADEAIELASGMDGSAILQLVHMTNAISRIHAAPDTRETRRAVRKAIALHNKWATGAPANYAAPLHLIEGTWAAARGDHRRAERELDRAMELADENQLPLIAAAAHEEAAALYAATGRHSLSQHMLRSAYQRFLAVGMTLRTDRIAHANPWLMSRDLVQPGVDHIDPAGAHQVIRALAAARTLDAFAEIVLGTVAQSTSAHRVVLLTGDSVQLSVQAVREGGTTTAVEGPWTEVRYDEVLVREVATYGTLRMTGDARRMAVPIRLQDNTIGLVYAERDATGSGFRSDHQEVVSFLCAQAAAPFWNFQLEARLRAADEYRRSLMDVQARFVPNELLRILDVDDISMVRNGYRVERRMTVLISDIRGYTTMVEDMNVTEVGNLANGFVRAVELPIISCNGMIQDIRGDEIVAVFESEADAVRAGLGMLRSLREHNRERVALGSAELHAGVGINTGELAVGMVGGVNRMVLTIMGDAVNLAARIESTNKRYGSSLLISEKTRKRLPDGEFDIRRMERVMVVNRRRPVTIYEVYDEDPEELRVAKCSAQGAFDEAFTLFDAGEIDAARTAFERCSALLPDDPIAPLHLTHCDAVDRGELTPGQDITLAQK